MIENILQNSDFFKSERKNISKMQILYNFTLALIFLESVF